jgi:hypothetical protein
MSWFVTSVSYPADAVPSFFAGNWHASRKVVDHLARRNYAFEGSATITGDAFAEHGEVVVGNRSFDAQRAYRLDVSHGAVDVRFPDGRLFVKLDRRASQRVEHLCGDDLYTGHVYFVSRDIWVEFWRVRGPRKRYTSLTRFERAPAA